MQFSALVVFLLVHAQFIFIKQPEQEKRSRKNTCAKYVQPTGKCASNNAAKQFPFSSQELSHKLNTVVLMMLLLLPIFTKQRNV